MGGDLIIAKRNNRTTKEAMDVYKITEIADAALLSAHIGDGHVRGEDLNDIDVDRLVLLNTYNGDGNKGDDGHHEREHEEEDHELFQDKDDEELSLLRKVMGYFQSLAKDEDSKYGDRGLEHWEHEEEEHDLFQDKHSDEEREFVVVHGETAHTANNQRWMFPMVLIGGALTVCGAVMVRRCKDTPYTPLMDGGSGKTAKTMYV